jgi:hypothetical protein
VVVHGYSLYTQYNTKLVTALEVASTFQPMNQKVERRDLWVSVRRLHHLLSASLEGAAGTQGDGSEGGIDFQGSYRVSFEGWISFQPGDIPGLEPEPTFQGMKSKVGPPSGPSSGQGWEVARASSQVLKGEAAFQPTFRIQLEGDATFIDTDRVGVGSLRYLQGTIWEGDKRFRMRCRRRTDLPFTLFAEYRSGFRPPETLSEGV